MRFAVLAFIAAFAAAPAHAANWGAINCDKAKAADEKAICASTELVQLDAQMSTEFGLMKGLVPMGTRGDMMDEQKDWLAKRSACRADEKCLRRAYDQRIRVLERMFDRVKAHGPF